MRAKLTENTPLNAKQSKFFNFLFDTGNATEAARLAGYAHPNQAGPRLAKHPNIQKLLTERRRAVEQKVVEKLAGGITSLLRRM